MRKETFLDQLQKEFSGLPMEDKVFIVNTNTGNTDAPKTINGGKCEIRTSTGDIRITIQ